MLRPDSTNHSLEVQNEKRLLSQARSGDTQAFMQLYDAHIDHVYRYIYFLASDDMAAEVITSRVFIRAWENLKRTLIFPATFITTLYKIAKSQVHEYYRSHARTIVPDDGFALVARRSAWDKEFQGIFDPQAVRDTLQLLSEDQRQVLILKFTADMPVERIARLLAKREGRIRDLELNSFQTLGEIHARKEVDMTEFQQILEDCLPKLLNGTTTVEECLARYPEHARELRPLLRTVYSLNLAGALKPTPVMKARTHENVLQYLRFHRRQPLQRTPLLLRVSFAVAMLMIAFVITGTARAQSALPGQPLYGWKRASEQVWRAVSIDPVGTDIAIANRRLNEWIATSDDPELSGSAMAGYLETMQRLQATHNVATLSRMVPVIRAHRERLDNAGFANSDLGTYVTSELQTIPVIVATQVAPTAIPPTLTAIAIEPTQTQIPPTQVPPTATEIPPTATAIPPTPTEVPPTATEVPPTPTEVPPTATEVPPTPTEVPPTATEVPPTSTPAPPATDIPATQEPGIQGP